MMMPEVGLSPAQGAPAHGVAAVQRGQARDAVRHRVQVPQNRLVVHPLQPQKLMTL